MRTERDCLFDGTGPDVSEENLAPLRKGVVDSKATAGLATDGDADRFGIVDCDGAWIQPNLILALVYDYLAETRKWKMPAARSVATTQMIDAVAKSRGQTIYQTPVGFKYIGQLIREDKIALGGEESAGLTIRGHIPEKDGILACLLVAEMIAARGASIGEQVRNMYKKLGREFWPVRENLHLSDEQKANAVKRVAVDASTLAGRKVVSIDRWRKICFRRRFVDAAASFRHGAAASPVRRSRKRRRFRKIDARRITMGSAKLKKTNTAEKFPPFLRQHGRALLALLVLVLLVHDIFGTHGFLAMRRKQLEIKKVTTDLDQLNKENLQLEQEVRELKTDPRKIEKIARDELGLAKPGEVIIKIPRAQQLLPDSSVKP